uniref:Entry exclusion protein 1 n=1 Tax=Paracoccus marcusii TaxID=59779 RepID=R4L413_9RHOB|nr:entry exclusion protein 1 [Paracoccus marcusii]AGL12895.1 entry exclusion protein 1 [Paracoccus marcusii]
MAYTLGEAAKASGKSKGTISKAIKSGRLSAVKQDTGAFRIEAAELHRVYPKTVDENQNRTPQTVFQTPENTPSVRELQARLEAAQERLADRDAVITDLREDRDRWRQQASALLADQRPVPQLVTEPALQPHQPVVQPPKGFWKRLFG